MPTQTAPYCFDCHRYADFYATSEWRYFTKKDYGPVWVCSRCDASVGAFANGTPKGRLAGMKTRELRRKAHDAFDPLWREKAARTGISEKEARTAAYRWLSAAMNVEPDDCHIAKLSDEDLIRVVELCLDTGYWKKRK